MPTIAVSTYSFGPACTAVRGIEFAAEHGFHGLELGSWTLWPDCTPEQDRRRVRSISAWQGIDLSIHFIHRGVAPATHDAGRRAKHLKELAATLELAQDIGARPIVVHPGPIDCPGVGPADAPESARREAIHNLIEFLGQGARFAEETGTVICVENLQHAPGMVIQSYGELVEVVRAVGSPAVRITLDVGHADLSDGLRPAFETFAPYLRHIHVHDSNGQRDHLEIGKGGIDWLALHDALAPYPFTLAIESRDEADEAGCVLRSRDSLKATLGLSAR